MLPSEVEDVYMSDWWSSFSLKSGVVLDEHLIPLARRFRIFVHEMVSLVAFHIVTTFFFSFIWANLFFLSSSFIHDGQTLSLFFPLAFKSFVSNKQLFFCIIQAQFKQR